jgi:glucose-6-phosphate isomerase
MQPTLDLRPGALADAIASHAPAARRALDGLWQRDPGAWSSDAGVQGKIRNRLGWLDSPRLMAASIDLLTAFSDALGSDRFTDVVLLGMGGSSLAPEVLHRIIGAGAGAPRFHMLDSTDPDAVTRASTPPASTLYILASKSGTTIEPNSLAAHFREQLEREHTGAWASHFVAITDEGTELAARARSDRYRDLFINPSDIGGRYSALSFFGMVPSAAMRQNTGAIVQHGLAMLEASDPARGPVERNPSALLGLALGAAARSGRDKLTLVMPPTLQPLGLWIEQLIAESTGKQGKGIVPIAGEALTSAYGDDRFFVRIGLATEPAPAVPAAGNAPVASIELASPEELGAEFVRWEIATAIAGAILEINPFDEPNVQQAKDATNRLLDEYRATGALPSPRADATLDGGVTLTLASAARSALGEAPPTAFLRLLAPGDYLGLLAYLAPDTSLAPILSAFRTSVLGRTATATMFGFGPRYLHSTGQLHKGGPNSGVFVLVTATPETDVPIPAQPFSFGTLEMAQALGDFASLDASGRRAVHLHLPARDAHALKGALDALLKSLP